MTKPVQEDALLSNWPVSLCGPGEKVRILIVEDDLDLARVIRDVFSRDIIEVHVAHTRQGAPWMPASASSRTFMVLDIGLPDGDGFNVVDCAAAA